MRRANAIVRVADGHSPVALAQALKTLRRRIEANCGRDLRRAKIPTTTGRLKFKAVAARRRRARAIWRRRLAGVEFVSIGSRQVAFDDQGRPV